MSRHWRVVDVSALNPLGPEEKQCSATMYLEGLRETVRCLRPAGHNERIAGCEPPTYGDEQHWYDVAARP